VAHTCGGGARERARDINHRIIEDRAGEPLVFNRASQNVVAAAMLLCNMPKPSTHKAWQAHDEFRLEAPRACLEAAYGALMTGERGLGSSRARTVKEQGSLCP
jgi:hypothetical protein